MTTYYADVPGASEFRTADLVDDTAAVVWGKALGADGIYRRGADGELVEINLNDPDGLWPLRV